MRASLPRVPRVGGDLSERLGLTFRNSCCCENSGGHGPQAGDGRGEGACPDVEQITADPTKDRCSEPLSALRAGQVVVRASGRRKLCRFPDRRKERLESVGHPDVRVASLASQEPGERRDSVAVGGVDGLLRSASACGFTRCAARVEPRPDESAIPTPDDPWDPSLI